MAIYNNFKYTDDDKKTLVDISSKFNGTVPNDSIRLLYHRGIKTYEEMYSFIYDDYSSMHNDKYMAGERQALEYLKGIKDPSNYQIVFMGDYDTDGCMATSVGTAGLRKLGYKVNYYMNSRFVDGYGLKKASVDEIVRRYPDVKLIITVDNGILAHEAIDYASSLGIDVIVTDHHTVGETLPNCVAVIDPKRKDCNYPFKGLCGAGVIWKLVYHLNDELHPNDTYQEEFFKELLVYVGLATVSDQMPLIGENRIIVKECLKMANSPNTSYFMIYLKNASNVNVITTETLGYYIGPMINAMGRVQGNPISVVDAVLSEEHSVVKEIVYEMHKFNVTRKEMTALQLDTALAILPKEFKDRGIVVHSDKFSEGIIGLIAGRLTEKFYRPTFALSKIEDTDLYKGSGRSIDGIDVMDILYKCDDLLESYGGHPMACGLTIKEANIEEFNKRMLEHLATIDEDVFIKKVVIDFVRKPNQINMELCKSIKFLEPFGNSFRRPLVMLKGFNVSNPRIEKPYYVGKSENVLRLVEDSGMVAVGFKAVDKFKYLGEPSAVNLIGEPSINEFNGYVSVQFLIDTTCVFPSN